MADSCCGEEWLGFEDDFVIKLLSKKTTMRLKQACRCSTLNLIHKICGQVRGYEWIRQHLKETITTAVFAAYLWAILTALAAADMTVQ